MSKTRKNQDPATRNKKTKQRLVKDSRTGHFALTAGKKFTKEDLERDFPDDTDRDSIILRKSVGL